MTIDTKMVRITVERGRTVLASKPGSITGEMVSHGPGDTLYIEESEALFLVQSGFASSPALDGKASTNWQGGPATSIGDFQ